jgi:cardiolipin synthase (CMP-forming)
MPSRSASVKAGDNGPKVHGDGTRLYNGTTELLLPSIWYRPVNGNPDIPAPSASPPSLRHDLVTLPNALSLLRMLLGLAFPWCPADWHGPVIVIAALSDLGDGALSRLFGMGSRAGRVLDPVADKVFVAGVLVAFLQQDVLSWVEFLLIAARDLVVIAGTVIALTIRHWTAFVHLAPTLLGKTTTAAQFAFFLVLATAPAYRTWLLVPTAALSLAAALQYLALFLTYRKIT